MMEAKQALYHIATLLRSPHGIEDADLGNYEPKDVVERVRALQSAYCSKVQEVEHLKANEPVMFEANEPSTLERIHARLDRVQALIERAEARLIQDAIDDLRRT